MQIGTFLVLATAAISAQFAAAASNDTDLPLADYCNGPPTNCKLPDCRCSGVDIPGGLNVSDVPQFVVVTFDDAVTLQSYHYAEGSFRGRKNRDNCSAAFTFFVSHEYTDYERVNALWSYGHELGLRSITNTPLSDYWRYASVDVLKREFGGQREQLAHFANVTASNITGLRVPYLELSGNNSFLALIQLNLTYDYTWTTKKYTSPGLWPYNLQYRSSQECEYGNCPTAFMPKAWEHPLLTWLDKSGTPCVSVDSCANIPDEEDEIVRWMVTNFNNSYHTNKAPFSVFVRTGWFASREVNFRAYNKFLDYLQTLPDVYLVSANRVVEWTRNPIALSKGGPFTSCQRVRAPSCNNAKVCRFLMPTGEERYMTSCQPCPVAYPWLDDPLGHGFNTTQS
ncbi:uncharacterized protein LOC113375456 [Ctenocephalides felis]|uniref:uncharacterized protein LOC113375456 n=1 Tax=Ctenocephalides felis TaxID=7515 RepID=UPI000E6E3103|nr:uncharacterized protein LOC113375456 [Ctenocephalides felis]